MRKNSKIIQIAGVRGLLVVLFFVTCLIMGFVIFPGVAAMAVWNVMAVKHSILPSINLLEGILLWAIIALSLYLACGAGNVIEIKSPSQLDDCEVQELMSRIRKQAKGEVGASISNSEISKDEKIDTNEISLCNSKKNDKE